MDLRELRRCHGRREDDVRFRSLAGGHLGPVSTRLRDKNDSECFLD